MSLGVQQSSVSNCTEAMVRRDVHPGRAQTMSESRLSVNAINPPSADSDAPPPSASFVGVPPSIDTIQRDTVR
jgi:hypothetical protein